MTQEGNSLQRLLWQRKSTYKVTEIIIRREMVFKLCVKLTNSKKYVFYTLSRELIEILLEMRISIEIR